MAKPSPRRSAPPLRKIDQALVARLAAKNQYIGTRQAAKILGVVEQRVRVFCSSGRIKGAFKVGNTWLMPPRSLLSPHIRRPMSGKPPRRKH